MAKQKHVVIGLLGPTLDAGTGAKRWDRWRPSVSVCQHEDLRLDRYILIYQPQHVRLLDQIVSDIQEVSPSTVIQTQLIDFNDPWDFEEVYGRLHDFSRSLEINTDRDTCLIHITTGSHVQQICLFLLTESRHLPGRLLQTSPPRRTTEQSARESQLAKTQRRREQQQGRNRQPADAAGSYRIIDLDLSQYDRLAQRFERERFDGVSFLKNGIKTKNAQFNRLIDEIEHVASQSKAPLLLMGPTGAGKSKLARRIFELKKSRQKIAGQFVELNCAVLRGDQAMSALFGHVKGSFTGATIDRPGVLKMAHQGVLFLDEIGELGTDEQAMLLRALEEKRFMPVGSDKDVTVDFQLVSGTNRDLRTDVADGRFRADLLARINLWTFELPGLQHRPEDIEPNLEFEIDEIAAQTGRRISFNKESRDRFLRFATAPDSIWAANFRDLNAAIVRMATLAPHGRITAEVVDAEILRLRTTWGCRLNAEEQAIQTSKPRTHETSNDAQTDVVEELLGQRAAAKLDLFDRTQLAAVINVCRGCRSISEAGRLLFAESRKAKANPNDADRLRKYLARFNLSWSDVATTS
jgi:transcriptional regulatory protein RtcR